MSRRTPVGLGAAAVAVLAAGALLWPRGTTQVTEEEALRDFRDRGAEATARATPADAPTSAVPEPGVYTFRATGREEAKLGPLPTETRPLPDSVTAVVVDRGDGCFELTVNLFAEHTEDTRYCTAEDTLTLAAHTKHQRIGPLSPTASMACDPATLLGGEVPVHDLTCTLELSGGPAAISATLVGTATRGRPEERTVGTDVVTTTPLTVAYDVSGDLAGTWTETLWLTAANLPVRIERTLDLAGPATFAERSDLVLTSLTPST